MSTFVANFDAAFYKLYLVDPSEQNIMVLSPANDGSGYPLKPIGPPAHRSRRVDGITDLLIDGDIYVAENGGVARVIPATELVGRARRSDAQLRPDPDYTMIVVAGPAGRRVHPGHRRPVRLRRQQPPDRRASTRSNGKYIEQYRLEGDDDAWEGLRDFVVLPGADADAPKTVWWISDDRPPQRASSSRPRDRRAPRRRPGAPPPGEDAAPKPTKTPRP